MTPNLSQIRSFVAIGKLGSFTQAAHAVNLSQPALTVQIRQLEASLNVKILDRNTRAVRLTRVGEELLSVFERLLGEFDAVVAGAKDIATKRLGVVRLSCLPSFAATVLPKAIVAFRAHHPGIQFLLKDGVGRKIVSLVNSEDVDFGIAGGEVNDPDVQTQILTRDEMHAVYLSPHALDKEKKLTADLLARQPLVLMDEDSTVRQVVDLAFSEAGFSIKPVLEATYMSTAVGMAKAGLGIAILPSTAIEAQPSGKLKSRRIEGSNFGRSIFIVRKSGRTLPPASEAFVATLLATFSKRTL